VLWNYNSQADRDILDEVNIATINIQSRHLKGELICIQQLSNQIDGVNKEKVNHEDEYTLIRKHTRKNPSEHTCAE